jgi:TonB-dependent starch-binding outer membrane protein SusC
MKNVIRYLCFLVFTLCAGTAWAQTVTGTVTDAQSMPVPGATVLVKGTQVATATDIDGNYSIEAPSGSTLEFSFLGYTTQSIEVRPNTTVLNVTLAESSEELDEIVVVGAVVKRGDLTGATTSLTGEKLKDTPSPNIVQGMQGRMAGVYVQQSTAPGGGTNIKIRGNNSLMFGTNPIFVVDGLIMEGNFENINPNDIASIDVLKDASATAIYGSRGANGVVVITTKKGSRSGEGKVEYETWVGISEFTKKIPLMNAQQLFDLRVDAFANAYADGTYSNASIPSGLSRDAFVAQVTADGSPIFAQYELDTYRSGKSYNWLDQVTQTGVQTNHNLAFSGGGDKGTYYVSLNYVDQDGLLKNSGFKRYNAKINMTQDVKPWLQIGTNTTFSHSEASYQEGSAFGTALGANPLLPIDPTATYLRYGENPDPNLYNPILSLTIVNQSKRNKLTSSNYINIKPVKELNIRSTFNADIVEQANFDYVPINTGQSIRNSMDGEAHHWRYQQLNYQWDNTVSYNKVFNEKHDLSAFVGASVMKNSDNSTDVRARGFAADDFTYMYLGGASQRENFQLSSDFVTTTVLSAFARANYVYNGKYNLTATVRRDGSSKFGPNYKWGTFPSVAAGWDIAKEDFLAGAQKLNTLRLRASYGIAGNQNIPNYGYLTLYRPTVSNGQVIYQPVGPRGNPNMRWEEQKQFNIGLDAAAFDNRLSVGLNYFDTKNDGLLMWRTLAITGGYGSQLDNVGETTNKGVEFQFSADVIKNEDFRWNVSGNISSARNRLTKMYGDATEIYSLGGYTGAEIQRTGNYFLGKSINNIYVFQYDGIAQEGEDLSSIDYLGRTVQPGDIKIKDRNGDGKITDADRYVAGDMNPDFYGGFSTDFSYKGFALNAVFAYSIGGKRTSWIYESYMGSGGLSAAHQDLLNRWTPENTDTDVPRAYYGGGRYSLGETDKALQNASFLRLNALTLSYTLPTDLVDNVYLKGARFYVTGSNLFTITKYKGYDPEGGDSYPNSRMLVMGVNVSF